MINHRKERNVVFIGKSLVEIYLDTIKKPQPDPLAWVPLAGSAVSKDDGDSIGPPLTGFI